jgi:hypothetical protein
VAPELRDHRKKGNAMKRQFSPALLALAIIAVVLPGCSLIGGLIKGAFWLGVIVVLIVIALIWWLVNKMRGPRS